MKSYHELTARLCGGQPVLFSLAGMLTFGFLSLLHSDPFSFLEV